MNADALNAWAPQARAVLRIVTALLFLQHGIMKLTGFPMEMPGGGEGGGLPPLILIASWMEVVGSILLIVGLFTRPVAFLLSGEMAVAYFMAHAPQSVYPIVNQGEVAILFCFIFLYLVFAGGGAWSVDRSMRGAPDVTRRLAAPVAGWTAGTALLALPAPASTGQDRGVQDMSDIDSRYAWLRLLVSVVLSAVGGVGMWAVVVVLPAVQAEFGVDRGEAAFAYTLTMAGFALGNALIGRAIDRWGFSRPGLVAAVVLGIGFLLAARAPSMATFGLIQGLLIGTGSAATFGPLIADISHWFVKRRGIAVATAASGNYFAGAIWPAIMPHFILADGWRATYSGIGIVCLVAMLPLTLLLRRRRPRGDGRAVGGAAGPARPVDADRHVARPAAGDPGGRRHLVLRCHVDAAGAHRRLLHGPRLRRRRAAPRCCR